MRIAFAVYKFDPLGGKERDALTLADMFRERGHAVTLITSNPAGFADRFDTVETVPESGRSNHARTAGFSARVAALRGSGRFDAVLGFEKIGGLDYYYGEGLSIRSMTGPLARLLPRKRALLALEAEVFGPRSKTFVFFLAERQMEQYRAAYGFAAERAQVLPTTLHPDRARPAAYYADREKARRELGIPADAPLAVNVATFARQKGVDRVIDALPALAGVHFLSIGLKDATAMKALARRRDVADRVHFLAYSEDIPHLVGAADLMVHPARIENTGSVIVESLLFGVPVVATENCGYAVHIARADAGAVLPENVAAGSLAETVRAALEPEKLARLRENARSYADFLEETAGFDRIAAAMLETMEKHADNGS